MAPLSGSENLRSTGRGTTGAKVNACGTAEGWRERGREEERWKKRQEKRKRKGTSLRERQGENQRERAGGDTDKERWRQRKRKRDKNRKTTGETERETERGGERNKASRMDLPALSSALAPVLSQFCVSR